NANQCKNAVISVYSKRGLLLFQTTGLERQWDGTYHGETLPMDTYYYTIDLKLSYVKRTYKGAITILR
ncbi:MAG: gliding motility-associated C-terminal domain-containing protein, partial [Cyclobacteriaceae bacterium]|nr:gliding motility-associated C-terminal domain-containing protein [Cyclobacteriaceae bacterium]